MMAIRANVLMAYLLAAMAAPARATPPPPVPPCVPAGPAVTAGALGAILAAEGHPHTQYCAAKDLGARGAAAVPVALRLLLSSNPDSQDHGFGVLAALGPRAHAALPALMDRIRKPTPHLQTSPAGPYAAIAAIGARARPAIPLLIVRSRDPRYRYYAVNALGELGKHEPGRVVPHLVAMVEGREGPLLSFDTGIVLRALAEIGKGARAALPAVLAALEGAKMAGNRMEAPAAIDALLAIAEPGESVPVLAALLDDPALASEAVSGLAGTPPASALPALLDKLQRSRDDPDLSDRIVMVLAHIGTGSPAVQRQLLVEATQHDNWRAAAALAETVPLPADFAPALRAALARKPGDASLATALRNAQRAR